MVLTEEEIRGFHHERETVENWTRKEGLSTTDSAVCGPRKFPKGVFAQFLCKSPI